MVNPQLRPTEEPRRDDWLFEGHELGDALEAANNALEDDVYVLEQDGRPIACGRSRAARYVPSSSVTSSAAADA